MRKGTSHFHTLNIEEVEIEGIYIYIYTYEYVVGMGEDGALT